MTYLLDTHIFLWYITGDKKLTKENREIIKNKENDVYLSVASYWEIIIKAKSKNFIFLTDDLLIKKSLLSESLP